jgi:hypothetical protein
MATVLAPAFLWRLGGRVLLVAAGTIPLRMLVLIVTVVIASLI